MSSLRIGGAGQLYTARLLRRGFLLWLFVRLLVTGATAYLGGPALAGSVRRALLTTAVVVTLAGLDLRATHEDILLANLGVTMSRSLGLVAFPALLCEIALLLLLNIA